MRVFVTGATGFVGAAVVRELTAAGHGVIGLARSAAAAEALATLGVEVHRGDVTDPESLRQGAAKADAVVHTAFIHDFSRYQENCETDRRAVTALGEGLASTDRPLIVTSATGILPPGAVSVEEDTPLSGVHAHPRAASEEAAAALADEGLRVWVMRLPASVHGDGDHGFVPMLIDLARKTEVSAFVGDGLNRWPAVHRLDVARLYRLVLEADGSGGRVHGVAEEGVAFREIAEVIGRRLGVPAVGITKDEAAGHFGWMARFAPLDIPASAVRTRATFGWQPEQARLIADLDRPRYFET